MQSLKLCPRIRVEQSATSVMNLKRSLYGSCCLISTSCVFMIAGIVLLLVHPYLIESIKRSAFSLEPNSDAFSMWQKTPFPLIMDFYLFNWTNPEQVFDKSTKPHFHQIGPYRFHETKEKVAIAWNKNGTITYKHLKKWYFSNNSNLNDPVTTLNPVAVAAAYTARDWNYVIKKMMSVSLPKTVHITKTVGEMLFDGYKDPLIDMGRKVPFLTQLPPWDKFGWFYTRNGSADYEGVFSMGTGAAGSTAGRLYEWRHRNRTDYFEGPCGMINGSGGEIFPPRPPKTHISFFSADLCRTVALDYAGESTVQGLVGNRYAAGTSLLDNGTLVPENKCFCTGECVPSGAVNVSSCRFGSPSFVSLPHFLHADPYYARLIDGVKSDRKKHDFFITLEPTTGVPLEVAARLQINLLLQPISSVGLYENAPRVFVPMLWFEQVVKIPSGLAFQLKLLLNMRVISISISIILICVGAVLAGCAIYRLCNKNICGRKNKKIRQIYAEQVPLTQDTK